MGIDYSSQMLADLKAQITIHLRNTYIIGSHRSTRQAHRVVLGLLTLAGVKYIVVVIIVFVANLSAPSTMTNK